MTKTSLLTGVERTLDIPCTQVEYDAWEAGLLIQEAMPNLTPNQREFLLTGITEEEWDAEFPDV